jgi:hypothetical protein
MLPGSPEARAKMRMTLGQLAALPFSRSLRVEESWRASIWAVLSNSAAGGGAGRAATRPAALRRVRNFMVVVWGG